MAKDSRTEGRTLAEALLAWGDPAAVAELTELAEAGYDGPGIFSLEGPATACERKAFRYQELRSQLEQELSEKLRDGSLVATGYDSRAAIDAPPVAIPADRWRALTPNFEDSSGAGGGLSISGILVSDPHLPAAARGASSPPPQLRIAKAARRACLDGFDLKLTPRSLDLLVILAEGAIQGAAPVPKLHLEDRLLAGNFSDKAIGQAINRLKSELTNSGVCVERAQSLIENVRTVGYRLALSPSDIRIDD